MEAAPVAALGAGELRDAVREVVQHVQTRDALGAQQRHRVGVGLLEQGGQQVGGVDLGLLGALAVAHRVLQHAVEGEGLAVFEGLVAGDALQVLAEEALEGGLQGGQLGTRVGQDLGPLLVEAERVEQVLYGDVGVANT